MQVREREMDKAIHLRNTATLVGGNKIFTQDFLFPDKSLMKFLFVVIVNFTGPCITSLPPPPLLLHLSQIVLCLPEEVLYIPWQQLTGIWMKELDSLSSNNITTYSTSASELWGNSSKMERSSLYHCRFLGNNSCFYAALYFASLVSDPYSIRCLSPTRQYLLFSTDIWEKGWAWLSFGLRQLTKKAGPVGAEDKQVYDLCPYVIVLYGLLSPTNGSPRKLDALLRIPTPASLPSLWRSRTW